MALTDNGCVYGWGDNDCGQLGNGTEDDCSTPTLIDSLSEEFIIDICCGHYHSLVLTRNCEVFAFGNNYNGQCAYDSETNQLTPVKINISKVTAISCGGWHSLALTENGDVFGWGRNRDLQLGIENVKTQLIPLKLNVTKIKQIECGNENTLMLSIDGYIYGCGYIKHCLSHRIPTQLNSFTKFIKISATIHSELCVALSEDNKCYIFGKYYHKNNKEIFTELQQTELTSIDETFAFYEQITYKSLLIKIVSTKINENSFTEIGLLGFGGFSAVFKSKHKLTNEIYAIKKICFESEKKDKVLNEINILSKHKSIFIVHLYDYWIENNYYIGSECKEKEMNHLYEANKKQLLHIQLELCSLTLRDAINKIVEECKTPNNTLSMIGYYIASELYSEILECIHYLHEQNPKIIHRDLKPENILLTNFVKFNRFVKLSDFGLSTFHQNDDQSHSKYTGTKNYRAYELNFSTRYSTKVDIYSLGIILQELFCIDINNLSRNNLPELEPKMSYLVKLIQKQLAFIPDDRPNCDKILAEKHKWLLNDQQLMSDKCFKNLITKSQKFNLKIEDNFIEFFVQNKFNSKSQELKPNDQTIAKTNNQIISHSHNSETTSFIPSIASISSIQPIRSLADANTADMSDDNY